MPLAKDSGMVPGVSQLLRDAPLAVLELVAVHSDVPRAVRRLPPMGVVPAEKHVATGSTQRS